MKKLASLSIVCATFGLMSGAVQSADEPLVVASIGDVSGRVMVYDGQKYSAAKAGMPLEAGDRVVTLKDASAKVAFEKGCVASLEENAVLTISGVEVCAGDLVMQGEQPLMVAQAGALGGGSGGGGGDPSMLPGLAGMGGFGILAFRDVNRTSGSPASPH